MRECAGRVCTLKAVYARNRLLLENLKGQNSALEVRNLTV